MRILLINPPYITATSRWGVGHQVPLGLVLVGGALRDAGHEVRLLDAEAQHLRHRALLSKVREWAPGAILTGHSGSTPAHPVCAEMLTQIKAELPGVTTVYGGVYPTFHAEEILRQTPAVDVVVRGEGEATAVELAAALEAGEDLARVSGMSFRRGDVVVATPEREPIADLDAYRAGWELIEDWDRYQCFGLGRSAIVQFSRGCVHQCTYCGQRDFWRKWRHRDPVKFVEEIEWLYRTHDVRFFPLADENAPTDRRVWRQVLEELAARRLPIHLNVGVRAPDVVRDADLLPLYREAGLLYVLLGAESTRPEVLERVKKGATPEDNARACALLRANGIFTILFYLLGLDEGETWRDFRRARRELTVYSPDWVNLMYLMPHAWTPLAREAVQRRTVEPNQRRWDFRHPVLEQRRMRPWQVFAGAKWLELAYHLRWRLVVRIAGAGRLERQQLLWCLGHTTLVWFADLWEYFWGARIWFLRARG